MEDLLVVGAGQLGGLVAQRWLTSHPSATVTLKFRSHNPERTLKLTGDGFKVISSERGEQIRCKNVVFCAPPTANSDYAGEVAKTIRNHWDNSGCFVFTSTGSVYEENSGGLVDEESQVVTNQRSSKILDAEDHVQKNGGCVIRLGGLYTLSKGLLMGLMGGAVEESAAKPNGLINLIHYDDAARCVLACLSSSSNANQQIFLVSDGVPISRKEICEAVARNPNSSYKGEVKFTGGEDADGKQYCTEKVRKIMDWKPIYPSFAEFMQNSSLYESETKV